MLDSLAQLAFPLQALVATLLTWALTALGACVVFLMRRPNQNVMDAMLGLAGGVMVAAAFWSLLSPAIDMAQALGMVPWLTVFVGFLGGGILLFFSDRLFTKLQEKRALLQQGQTQAGLKRCAMLVFSITLHNIPEGISVAMPVWYATGSRRRAFRCTLLSGLTEPVGAVLAFALLRPFLNGLLLGVLFGAVAGIMVYIAVEELIPSSRQYGHDRPALWATLCGICVMPLTHLFQT